MKGEKMYNQKLKSIKIQKDGFTLLEMIVVIAIISIVIGLALPAINKSKADADNRNAEGNAKTLNEAILRAKIRGDTNPAITGSNANNVSNAAAYLLQQGYIQ